MLPSDIARLITEDPNISNDGSTPALSRSAATRLQKATFVKSLVDKPGLKVRLFQQTNDPAAAQILSQYCKQAKVGLVDPRLAANYLAKGDIYIAFLSGVSYFIQPATGSAYDNDDRKVDAAKLFEDLVSHLS